MMNFPEYAALNRMKRATETPFLQFAGNEPRSLEEWDGLYKHFMAKPTDFPSDKWKAKFKLQNGEV